MRGKGNIEVEFHPESEAYFEEFSAHFPALLASIREDFTSFIDYLDDRRETPPDRFGRFGAYTYPPQAYSARLEHVHICVPPRERFAARLMDERACRIGEPEKDTALVYAQHLIDERRYCLIAMLYPEAHHKSRNDTPLMRRLAEMAESFQNS